MKGKPYPGVSGEDMTLSKMETFASTKETPMDQEFSQVSAKATENTTGNGTKAGG